MLLGTMFTLGRAVVIGISGDTTLGGGGGGSTAGVLVGIFCANGCGVIGVVGGA